MRSPVVVVPALLALGLAAPARAQLGPVNPLSVGVAGGATIPLGTFGESVNTGFNVDGILTLRVPTLPVSFRVEVGYQRFAIKSEALALVGGELPPGVSLSGNRAAWQGVANVVYTLPTRTLLVRPYVIAGAGVYQLRTRVVARLNGQALPSAADPENEVGVNGGVGLDVPLGALTVFGEGRYHRIFADGDAVNLVPLRVGIRF